MRLKVVATILALVVVLCLLPSMTLAKDYKEAGEYALMVKGDKVVLDNGVVATYEGKTTDGKYQFTATISAPIYLDDLSTRINTIWHFDNGVFTMPNNLFGAEVKDGQYTLTYGQSSMTRNPQIYIAGKLQAPTMAMGWMIDDPINENYFGNTLQWTYKECTRNLRAIEGVLIDYYILDKAPSGDFEVKLNTAKDAGYTYNAGIEVYDAGYKSVACTLTADGVILTAANLKDVKFPVTIDPSSNFYTSASDGYLVKASGSWTTSRTSASADSVSASGTSAVVYTRQYPGWPTIGRTFLYFDTSSIPDSSTITDAKLYVYCYYGVDDDDAEVYIVSGMPTYPHDPLVLADYYYGNYGSFTTTYGWADLLTDFGSLGGYEKVNTNDSTTLKGIVSKTGYTKLGIVERRDKQNDAPIAVDENNLSYYTYEQGAGYRPYLEVTYTVVAPTVTVSAATLATNTTATLNGNVVETGGENPTVTVYWGDNDGGTTPASWDNSSAPTSPSQPQGVAAFYKDVTGLAENTLIYFKARAVNTGGTGWSSTLSFTTYGDPDVSTQAASAIAVTTARLNSVVNSDNGLPVTIRFGWGLTSESAIEDYDDYDTVAGTWTTGQHPYLDIATLTGSTLYYFMVEGTTAYGVDLGAVLNFTTENSVGDPSDFHGIPTGTTVSLTWTKGTGAGESVVRFATASYPTTPTEGFAVYSGTSASYLHTGLTGGTTLFYSLWGMSGGNYSTNYTTLMITTSADVTGGGDYTPPTWVERLVAAPDYTNLENVPVIYGTINAIADSWGMPRETGWFLFALLTSFALALLFYMISKHKFVIAEFTLEAGLVAWWIVQIMPFWIPLMAGIIIVGYAIGHQEVKTY